MSAHGHLRGRLVAVLAGSRRRESSGTGAAVAPAWLVVPGVLATSTLACLAIERHFEPAILITVYLAGVVYVALRHGRAAAVGTVIGSIVLFDLLFVPPRWSLKPADPQYFFAFAVTLLVGLVISELAATSRQEADTAEARARRGEAQNELALRLAMARDDETIAAALVAAVRQALGAEARVIGIAAGGGLGDDGTLPAGERGTAERALRERRETGAGTDVDPHCARRYLPLLAADGPLGLLAVEAVREGYEHADDRQLLRAFANQAAVALERSLFERRSARVAVEAETERLRSTLLTGISHDFRTPLTTIVGSAASLLEQRHAIGEAHRDALLRGVLNEAQRMHALISDLLDLTRMEEGAVRPEPEWCPVDELVDEARAALGPRLQDHRLEIDAGDDAVVWCDPRLLGQALVNLLDNAARHTPAGTTIAVRVAVGAGRWRLTVHDDGPGLPAGSERDVFKKFFRARQETDGHGTGLGLAICAVVAELHGGTIVARNVGGACFEMTLPQPAGAPARLQEAE